MHEIDDFQCHHESLFQRIESGVRDTLRDLGGFDALGNHLSRETWKDTELDDLVTAIMVHLRAGMKPVFSDIIIKEVALFVERNWT